MSGNNGIIFMRVRMRSVFPEEEGGRRESIVGWQSHCDNEEEGQAARGDWRGGWGGIGSSVCTGVDISNFVR